jgi:Tfp pilus assembly protein PilN
MIKINLAGKKRPVATSSSSSSGKTGLTLPRLDADSLRELPLARIGMNLVAAVAAFYLLQSYQDEELAKWDTVLKKQEAEQAQLSAEASKTVGFESQFKSLETDRLLLTSKMEAIKSLVSNRQSAPKLLYVVATGIPRELWLNTIKVTDDEIKVQGFSYASEGTGYDQITDFMQTLSQSAFFNDVKLVNTQKDKDESGVEVASFELAAKRK